VSLGPRAACRMVRMGMMAKRAKAARMT